MNRRSLQLGLMILILIGGTYLLLVRGRDRQVLGNPAVRLTSVPLVTAGGSIFRTNSVFLPGRIAGYESKVGVVSDAEIAGLPPDTSFGRLIYRSPLDGFTAQASVVLMGRDRTSIHQPDFCLTGAGWMIQEKRYDSISLGGQERGSQVLPVRRFDAVLNYTASDGVPHRTAGVYVFWFAADGEVTASHVRRTVSSLQHLILEGVLQRWSYTSFFAQCEPGQEDAAYSRLKDLIVATVPQFHRFEVAAAR